MGGINDQDILNIARVLAHREAFQRELFVETQGWQIAKEALLVDGFVDPLTGETMDIETAYTVAQTRDLLDGIMRKDR